MTLNDLNQLDIGDSKQVAIVEKFVNDLAFHFDSKQSWQAKRILDEMIVKQKVKERSPSIIARLDRVLDILKFTCIDFLSPEEVSRLLREALDIALGVDGWSVEELLRVFLVRLNSFEDDRARTQFATALEQNQTTRIGNEIASKDIPDIHESTVGNWLRLYRYFLNSIPDLNLAKASFRSGPAAARLSPEEKQHLTQITEAYDFIKTPVLVPEGYTEAVAVQWPDGEMDVFDQGVIIPAYHPPRITKETRPSSFSSIQATLQASQKDNRTAEEVEKLLSSAANGQLLRMLTDPNPIREEFVRYLRQEGKEEDLKNFELAPISPLSLAKFLHFVLTRRMRLDENQAAAVAVRVGNILKQSGKPEYLGIAYWDEGEGRFRMKN